MLVALASLKASPGVTTTALALTASWPAQRRLLIEADPSGGDLGPWLGLPPTPGLVGLAAAARHERGRSVIWRHARELAAGTHLVVAPAGAEQAAACLATLAGTPVLSPFTSEPAVAVADCGRLDPGSPALDVAAQAAVTLLLVRPQASDLSHLAPRIRGLATAGLRLGLLLAPANRSLAEAAYQPEEITATLKIPVHGSIPADPRAAAHLIRHQGEYGKARRLPLLRTTSALAAALAANIGPRANRHHPGSGQRTAPAHRNGLEVTTGDRHG
jgi:hypothetical protein